MRLPLRFSAGVLLPFVVCASFNVIMDPYTLFLPSNLTFQSSTDMDRIKHAFGIFRKKPDFLVIGSSRIRHIDPSHPVFASHSAYTASFVSGLLFELVHYVHFAQSKKPLSTLLLALRTEDFTTRNAQPNSDANRISANSWQRKKVLMRDLVKLLYSKEATLASFRSLFNHGTGANQTQAPFSDIYLSLNYCGPPGQQDYITSPLPSDLQKTLDLALQELRTILVEARQNNTDLRLFVTPFHVSRYEMPHDRLEAMEMHWKQHVVELLEQEAIEHQTEPFPFWDFSGYNSVNTQPFPFDEHDRLSNTYLYWDTSHIKKEGLSMILDRIFGTCVSPCHIPDDFGVLLTKNTIGDHMRKFEESRRSYMEQHPAIISQWQSRIAERCEQLAATATVNPLQQAAFPSPDASAGGSLRAGDANP